VALADLAYCFLRRVQSDVTKLN